MLETINSILGLATLAVAVFAFFGTIYLLIWKLGGGK